MRPIRVAESSFGLTSSKDVKKVAKAIWANWEKHLKAGNSPEDFWADVGFEGAHPDDDDERVNYTIEYFGMNSYGKDGEPEPELVASESEDLIDWTVLVGRKASLESEKDIRMGLEEAWSVTRSMSELEAE